MMFYSWPSLEAFDYWHQAVKTALGIPYPGRNDATGEIDNNAQWTTAYTVPIVVADDDVRAYVEDNVVLMVPGEIGTPCERPPESPLLEE